MLFFLIVQFSLLIMPLLVKAEAFFYIPQKQSFHLNNKFYIWLLTILFVFLHIQIKYPLNGRETHV